MKIEAGLLYLLSFSLIGIAYRYLETDYQSRRNITKFLILLILGLVALYFAAKNAEFTKTTVFVYVSLMFFSGFTGRYLNYKAIKPAILKPLLLKRDITWSDFNYPSLYAWLIVIALGILTGLDPQLQQDLPVPLPFLILFGIVIMAAGYWVTALFMGWWTKRKGCDSQGRMFRLVMAVSAIGLLGLLLPVLGLPAWVSTPIWLYSAWMAIHTLRQVCGISTGYALGGVILSSLLAMLVIILVGMVLGVVFAFIAPPATPVLKN